MEHTGLESPSGLLNIKQAAQVLNVSEVSLRRWTNGGKLSCLRVGARRERRFRREDLFAFAEQQAAKARPAAAPPAGGGAKVNLEGIAIEEGSHLCSLYRNDLGRLKLSVPFLAGGLRAGDVCYLIATPEAQDDILHHVGEVVGDIAGAIDDGSLVVSAGQDSGEGMHRYLEQNFVMATRAGNRSLRLVGDMFWALRKGMEPRELMAFERGYSHSLARRFPVVSLCQYDVREFSGSDVHEVLMCHEDTFCYPLSRFI